MIAATHPQEFIPSGRQQALRHPGPIEFASGRRRSTDDLLLNRLQRVSFSDCELSERWFLRTSPTNSAGGEDSGEDATESLFEVNTPAGKKSRKSSVGKRFSGDGEALKCGVSGKTVDIKLELDHVEEELYIKGNTVIWSKGYASDAKTTICAYTSQHPVKQAIWCTFYDQRPKFDTELPNHAEKKLPAICVVDTESVRVFTAENEDFIDALPFPVGNIWNTKYGIILEKQKDVETDSPAKLFSLAHPLEEPHPIAIKDTTLSLIDNFNVHIVFTSEAPSVALVYNAQAGCHSVYHVRRLKQGEWMEKTVPSSMNTSSKLKNRVSLWEAHNIQATPSPISSRTGSFCTVQRSHSSMAAISRCQSPAFSPQISGSPWLGRGLSLLSSHHSAQQTTAATTTTTVGDFTEICQPILCFEQIWTDYVSTSQDGTFVGPASKAFFCDDLTGQNYLCYLLPTKLQLCMVKLDFSHNGNFIFGVFTSMSAKDAVPVPHLHMLAILEPTGTIVLYSGLNMVGKLHIGGVLAEHTTSPFVRRNVPQFTSPFPRRSTLLPNCGGTPMAGPRFDDHLLSPVTPRAGLINNVIQVPFQTDLQKVTLNGLRDPIENRFTLQYSDGTYYRVTIPSLASSPLIESCINVIRHTLPRDAALTLLTRWYVTRNAPGPTDINAEVEWNRFCDVLLVLLGYENESGKDSSADTPSSVPPKRQKQSLCETDADWHWLKATPYHKTTYNNFKHLLNVKKSVNCTLEKDEMNLRTFKINEQSHSSVLFPYFHIIHFSFHLLYEELKLNTLRAKDLPLLVRLLCKLAGDLGLREYVSCYWRDFPGDYIVDTMVGVFGESELKKIVRWSVMGEKPYFLMEYLCGMLCGVRLQPFPYIAQVNPRSRDIVQLFGLLITGRTQNTINIDTFIKTVLPTSSKCEPFSTSKAKTITIAESVQEKAVILMTEMGITTRVLDTLPPGVALFLYDAIWCCRENPPTDFPAQAYNLLWRGDLAAQVQILATDKSENNIKKYGMYSSSQLQEILPSIKQMDVDEEDGMEDVENPVLKMRFSEDLRVVEARRLLQSSKAVIVNLVQRPDVSDHEFIEEEEKHLYAICTRTMALPVGRGMFTLRTATPVITEPLSSPPLCLTGKATSRGTTVELTHIDTPVNMNLWPLFHNGVANGLRITPDAHNIDKTWIMFNKPKVNETQMEHAGFLMALGLNGHLKNLGVLSTYDYLVKLHEMTSVGVLLGLAAAYRGTCDSSLTKALSIHVEALLPPTSMEIDVPQNLQVTALMGIGLLYQGTAHRHMTEILLTEIGRPPGPEMENSVDRESYSLSAGLALGFVTLKQGGRQTSALDLNVPDTLHYFMVGGHRRPLAGSQRDKYRVSSFQIKEGSSVNLDVTAPGATLALGLMYLGTGNKAVADWMAPPDTEYLLDFVRPDFLMLRILSRALIMWDEVEPTKDWIENQVPDTIRPFCMVTPLPSSNIDYEAMNQAYCNIVAGACFSVGLKFAGTADETAAQTLLNFCHMFTTLTSKSVADLAGKPTIETCLNVVLISAAMVMAGTGNLEIMRLVRYLRTRVGLSSSSVVTYGSHLMIHMALGLLFLGGGRYTLSNSPAAVAAMIAAFYPKFPTHSNDNRYHLQAFRHLYVLAVEPRLIIPRDVGFGRMCYAHIKVTHTDGATAVIRGPGILPDLNRLRKVEISDERYWPVVFERERNWTQLQKLLSTNGYVEVKQRAGCLSYMEDKLGYHSELARTLTESETIPWDSPAKAIVSFTSESTLRNFCDNYLTPGNKNAGVDEERLQKILTRVTYECVVKDKLVAIPIFAALFKGVRDLSSASNTLQLWQVKLALAQTLKFHLNSNLLSIETLLTLKDEAVSVLDGLEQDLSGLVKSYLAGEFNFCSDSVLGAKLSGYVIFYSIPFGVKVNNMDELLQLAVKLEESGFSSESISKILQILGI